ncbi:MAG: acetylxylan esterase [Verrucomicrobiaceae bacterium]
MRAIHLLLFLGLASSSCGQTKKDVNYDEAKSSKFAIPDPLVCRDGSKVTSADDWLKKRRPELLQLFAEEEYGRTPAGKPPALRFVLVSEDKHALGGKATMRQINIFFTENDEPHNTVLLYLPNARKARVPVFVGLNFGGNQSVANDPAIKLPEGWFRNDPKRGYMDNRATEQTRGSSAEQWPIEKTIDRGYGVATAYYGDFEPDHPEGLSAGIRPLFFKPGQIAPADDEWGAMGAWAWGLSRIADYLLTLPEVDSKKLAVLGHSRLGKSALWAAAQDERFSIVISNNSGAGGAALHKRIFGETTGIINRAFPNWFCGNFKKYSDNEGALPMDQHELIALMAPRPVYIASATEDLWADPKGEFLGGKLAEPVYALFGKEGLSVETPPPADKSVGVDIGYHSRSGKHDILLFDWEQYMNFADRHWGRPE